MSLISTNKEQVAKLCTRASRSVNKVPWFFIDFKVYSKNHALMGKEFSAKYDENQTDSVLVEDNQVYIKGFGESILESVDPKAFYNNCEYDLEDLWGLENYLKRT